MRGLNHLFSIIAAIAAVVLCMQILSNSIANQQNKHDYAELNDVKYGLFSIGEWKRQVTVILAEEINRLYLSKSDERVLRSHIEVLLNTLIDKVDKKIREDNAATAGGKIAQSFIDIFINLDIIKKGIPEYADAVIHEMTKAKTKRQVKAALKKQLENYANKTFDVLQTPQLNLILSRTGTENIEAAKLQLSEEIARKQNLIERDVILLLVLSVIPFVLSGFSKRDLDLPRYALLVFTLVILLIVGVTTPTIDIEAKISEMNFVLLGHAVHFENQVLYFQSKSILDVFRILIMHKDIEMKFVGILLVMFSIVFPLLKIVSTLGYYFDYRRSRVNRVIKFFVLSSGKWSMADVMVVAIFMAYIGFNGIIASQLGHLNALSPEMVLITTNGTSLQPGYYLFLAYTLLAIYLSELLVRKTEYGKRTAPCPPTLSGGGQGAV